MGIEIERILYRLIKARRQLEELHQANLEAFGRRDPARSVDPECWALERKKIADLQELTRIVFGRKEKTA